MMLLTRLFTGEESHVLKYPGTLIASRVYQTRNWWEDLRGLIGSGLGPQDALIIGGCHQVHTAFMNHAIDVAFCDNSRGFDRCCHARVAHIETLAPWRVSPFVRASTFVIEMRAGSPLALLRAGDFIELR